MDWAKRINQVMDYVEEHLNETISEKEIAKLAACSYSAFQSSFTQITGIPFSEYVRRRKLTCAAYDLQNTDEKIIDIALKYGYESPDAFRVAFKNLHGVLPSNVRKNNVKLTFYCRLHFDVIIKGVEKMDYTIVEKDAFKVMGIRRIVPRAAGTWEIVKTDGSNEKIKEISGKYFDLGLCFGFLENGSNDYMCAVEWEKESIDGFDIITYPPTVWLVFKAKGKLSEKVLGNVWTRINKDFLPNSKYKKCAATIEHYLVWDEVKDECDVDIWIPVEER